MLKLEMNWKLVIGNINWGVLTFPTVHFLDCLFGEHNFLQDSGPIIIQRYSYDLLKIKYMSCTVDFLVCTVWSPLSTEIILVLGSYGLVKVRYALFWESYWWLPQYVTTELWIDWLLLSWLWLSIKWKTPLVQYRNIFKFISSILS